MPETATQPTRKPRHFDRHETLHRLRVRAISWSAYLATRVDEDRKRGWVSTGWTSQLADSRRREERIHRLQMLLALPFDERRARVGAPFTELYEVAS